MSEQRAVRRGDIYYADLNPAVGSEQGGIRPCVIIQNNVGNRHSPTLIVAAITSRAGKPRLPTHVPAKGAVTGLRRDSFVMMEQVRTIDRSRLREYVGTLKPAEMEAADSALEISFGLAQGFR